MAKRPQHETEPQREAFVLEANVCWTLLRSANVGRLAVVIDDHPDIFPVNYVVDHGTVVFRTAGGTKLAAATASRPVAFEVDGFDPGAGQAWSIVVKGEAQESTTVLEVLDAMELPLFPWHGGPKPRFVRIVPGEVSGRRFQVREASSWRSPMTGAHHASLE